MSRPAGPPSANHPVAVSARRKIAWRLLPLLLILYVIAYLDRANLSFAKLQMSSLPWFTEEIYGWGAGLFFIGYLVLEVPGALLVEKWSARMWFARIMISWGICSMAMAFVSSVSQFYLVRFLLGLAEAGFFPGVIVYFTHWFPRQERARAMAVMLLGVPGSLALGARVSAILLKQNWFGLAGWQWVFLIEGAPAVLLGIALPWMLPDRPRNATWLSPAERDWLESTLEEEHRQTVAVGSNSISQMLRNPTVWLLALGIMATNIGGYVLVFWLPTAVKGLFSTSEEILSDTAVLNLTGLIYLAGMVGVWFSGWSSDRMGDRKWHCVAGQIGTALFLVLSVLPGQSPLLVMIWLCLVGFHAFFWPAPFWALPSMTLTATAAAVAIGIINMCANLAGFIGSPVVGAMKGAGMSDASCLLLLAASYALGAILVGLIRIPPQRPALSEGEVIQP